MSIWDTVTTIIWWSTWTSFIYVYMLGTFMVVPQMITKYLFNKKEEENLAAIISKIQKYDRDIRGDL